QGVRACNFSVWREYHWWTGMIVAGITVVGFWESRSPENLLTNADSRDTSPNTQYTGSFVFSLGRYCAPELDQHMAENIGLVKPVSTDLAAEELAAVEKLQQGYHNMKSELGKVIVGQEQVIEELLIALFCKGHALLVGVPGLAKTLLISTLAKTLGLSFNRIQFTPDLMPSDITGTEVFEEDKATGSRSMRFVRGPIF